MKLPPGIPDRGKPNLPENVDRTKPIELFRLIFDDYVIGKLTSFTNRNYWLNGLKRNQELARPIMQPVKEGEIFAFIAIQLYSGAIGVKDIESLWNTMKNEPHYD